MCLKYELYLSSRFIRDGKNKLSIVSVLAIIGIALSVCAIIVTMSLMNGFRDELTERILGINAHVTVLGGSEGLANYLDLLDEIRSNPLIAYAAPIINSEGMLIRGKNAGGVMIKGMRIHDLMQKSDISNNMYGRIFEEDSKNDIIVGYAMASRLDADVGDKVKVISPRLTAHSISMIPQIDSYRIVGVFHSGSYEYDNGAIFMSLTAAQDHVGYDDTVSGIEINAVNKENAGTTILELIQSISREHGISLRFMDWIQSNELFLKSLKMERSVMFLILFLMLTVASFGITTVLTLLIENKKDNIAIMKTMGMNNISIMRIFVIAGFFIGLSGMVIGVISGLLLSFSIHGIHNFIDKLFGIKLFNPAIYFLSDLPVIVYAGDILFTIAITTCVIILASLYPAVYASKLESAIVLRDKV